MTDKSLEKKAVDIKGKKYVLVSDRILYFNEEYPLGAIETELLSKPEDSHVVVVARVFPNGKQTGGMVLDKEGATAIGFRCFTGHSQAVIGEGMVNKTAALENAETSAVGRALAMMGIGVIDSVASVDEMRKAKGGVTEQIEEPFGDKEFTI